MDLIPMSQHTIMDPTIMHQRAIFWIHFCGATVPPNPGPRTQKG
jgi:hypothetical protein